MKIRRPLPNPGSLRAVVWMAVGCLVINGGPLHGQAGMPGMTAMENSVGFLSSGTSVEPRSTSEFAPMVHKTLGSWNLMLHANGFLIDTQQTGPRGADKFFSTN